MSTQGLQGSSSAPQQPPLAGISDEPKRTQAKRANRRASAYGSAVDDRRGAELEPKDLAKLKQHVAELRGENFEQKEKLKELGHENHFLKRKLEGALAEAELSNAARHSAEAAHADELDAMEDRMMTAVQERSALRERLQRMDVVEIALADLFLEVKDNSGYNDFTEEELQHERDLLRKESPLVVLGKLRASLTALRKFKDSFEDALNLQGQRRAGLEAARIADLESQLQARTQDYQDQTVQVERLKGQLAATTEVARKQLDTSQQLLVDAQAETQKLLEEMQAKHKYTEDLESKVEAMMTEGKRRDKQVVQVIELEVARGRDYVTHRAEVRKHEVKADRQHKELTQQQTTLALREQEVAEAREQLREVRGRLDTSERSLRARRVAALEAEVARLRAAAGRSTSPPLQVSPPRSPSPRGSSLAGSLGVVAEGSGLGNADPLGLAGPPPPPEELRASRASAASPAREAGEGGLGGSMERRGDEGGPAGAGGRVRGQGPGGTARPLSAGPAKPAAARTRYANPRAERRERAKQNGFLGSKGPVQPPERWLPQKGEEWLTEQKKAETKVLLKVERMGREGKEFAAGEKKAAALEEKHGILVQRARANIQAGSKRMEQATSEELEEARGPIDTSKLKKFDPAELQGSSDEDA